MDTWIFFKWAFKSAAAVINISSVMVGIEDRLMEMELGPLFGLWFQSLCVGIRN